MNAVEHALRVLRDFPHGVLRHLVDGLTELTVVEGGEGYGRTHPAARLLSDALGLSLAGGTES